MLDPQSEKTLSPLLKQTNVKIVAPVWSKFSSTFAKKCHELGALVFVDEEHSERTNWRLALSWGVEAYKVKRARSSEEMVAEAERILRKEKLAEEGDRIVAIFGTSPTSGASNTMAILTL